MVKKIIIGVMGPGKEATEKDINNALQIGELIASHGWMTLSGGMKTGVMGAVNERAKKKKGLTIGILPNDSLDEHSENIDIPMITNMRAGRNYINALSCDVMVACGMNAGTSSEVSHAIQANKPIVLLGADDETKRFFQKLGGKLINISSSPKEAINLIINLVGDKK